MPANCNGLDRLNKNDGFHKDNCFWAFKKKGCKRKTGELKPKRIVSASRIKYPVSICLTMEKDHLDVIKSLALHRSVEVGHIVEANDMIRDALKREFPIESKTENATAGCR